MFYIKGIIGAFWFFASSAITFVVSVFRWRHPSNGYFFAQLFTRPVMWLIGMKIVIHNKHLLKETQPCIYVGNHQNNLDIVVQAACYQPRTIAIGKKEVLWIPFFGVLFYLSRNILLDRKNREKAIKGLEKAKRYLTQKNISIWIFPEGTRNRDAQELLPFKKGAFHMAIDAQVPLLPVIASPSKPLVDWKNKTIRSGTINVNVLNPIPTKGLTENDVDSLMKSTRDAMQKAFSQLKTDLD